jgi:hypothetical protein
MLAYYAIYESEEYREKEGLPFTPRTLRTCIGFWEDIENYDEEKDEYPVSVEHIWLKDERSGLCFDALGWRTEDELLADYPYIATDNGWILADGDRQMTREIHDMVELGMLKPFEIDGNKHSDIHEKFRKVFTQVEIP